MRTTVTIDDDVLAAARALAARKGVSVGRVLSDLARRGIRTGAALARRQRRHRRERTEIRYRAGWITTRPPSRTWMLRS